MVDGDFRTVARVEDLQPGTVTIVEVDGQTLALARVGDDFFATQNACVHLEGPLGEGRVDGFVLTCPWHGWQYDVRSGENEFDRAIQLRTYPVRVEDGEVKVAV